MIHQILTDIQEKLKEVPGLRYIADDWSQLEYEQPPVQFPCALVDVDGFDYSQTGRLHQLGTGAVYVRVADLQLTNTSANAPASLKKASETFFNVIDEVHKSLHGFSGGNYSALIRTSLKRVSRNDGIKEYLFTFKTAYTEQNVSHLTPISANPVLKME